MWSCRKCGKPVYFAERKQSLGYDWHPECLRCEECGKRLNPGQHAEHKGVPYCHIPCYSALFGPTLFGHGSQVESHKSFGKVENRVGSVQRSHIEAKLKLYNQFYEGNSHEVKCRERNGKLILEGVLRIYWGVNNLIHLKEDDDQRTHVQVVRKRNSYRQAINNGLDDDSPPSSPEPPAEKQNGTVAVDSADNKVDSKTEETNCGTERTETKTATCDAVVDAPVVSESAASLTDECLTKVDVPDVVPLQLETENKPLPPTDSGTTTPEPSVRIRKMASSRSRTKLKRRCSINGHYYNRETSVFTPPHGSASNVWITSLVNAPEVINMLLDKFRVENNPQEFALYVVRDNGETRRIKEDEYPLLTRVILGPHEDVAKVFIMDKNKTNEISSEVAQFLNFSAVELNSILRRYHEEEEREWKKIKKKFRDMKYYIRHRMAEILAQRRLAQEQEKLLTNPSVVD